MARRETVARGAGPKTVAGDPMPAPAPPVSVVTQLRRAAWMTAFPATIGLFTLLFHSWRLPPASALASAIMILLAGGAVFFVVLAGASLVGSSLRGPAFAVRTRTVCPACGRSLWIIQTRCSGCDAPVPVSRNAFPTFAYTAVAYAVFQILVLLALHRWDLG